MGGWGVPPVDERRVSRGLLSRRPELAGHPAHGVGLQGIDGEGNFLDQMAGAALESTLLKATFAWRDPSQSHPVLAGRTRWPLSNRNAHHQYPEPTIGVVGNFGLYAFRLSRTKIWHNS